MTVFTRNSTQRISTPLIGSASQSGDSEICRAYREALRSALLLRHFLGRTVTRIMTTPFKRDLCGELADSGAKMGSDSAGVSHRWTGVIRIFARSATQRLCRGCKYLELSTTMTIDVMWFALGRAENRSTTRPTTYAIVKKSQPKIIIHSDSICSSRQRHDDVALAGV